VNARYNNFYEFGTTKNIVAAAQRLQIRPWTIKIDGLVEKEREIGIDDLLKAVQLEERLYRMRCVEAWSMTVPWSGFAMKQLVDLAKPASGAKFIRIETFMDPKIAPGQRQVWYPWPYVDGCTIEEARNDLAFMVTGAYGKPLGNQFGAPLRVHMPWKYGFKAVKSIRRITFTNERPVSFWEKAQASEYGFWANVNPAIAHPRWSQATEEVLGEGRRVPTLIWNGYGEFVADMYKGMEGEKLFI
jgi:sulfoxide reductase catalytic subunit YedY